jgi:hypothetical protein
MGFQGGADDLLDNGYTDVNIVKDPTFVVSIVNEPIGSNKSMISLMNAAGSGVTLKIMSIKVINTRTTAVTGIIAEFRVFRITGHSGGTLLAPLTHDSLDSLNANVSARTPATLTGIAANSLYRWLWSSDEWMPGTPDIESSDHVMQTLIATYEDRLGAKPITLRAGEGFTINQITNSTVGNFDIEIVFTQS